MRSPKDVTAKQVDNLATNSTVPATVQFLAAGVTAGAIVFSVGQIYSLRHHDVVDLRTDLGNRVSTSPEELKEFKEDQKDVLIEAAAQAGLPHIVELYLTAPTPLYYDAGDVAYTLAATSSNKDEILKYRKMLINVIDREVNIAPESKASLFYALGKIDLLLSDSNTAFDHFKTAISIKKTTVDLRLKGDPETHKFLIDKGLM